MSGRRTLVPAFWLLLLAVCGVYVVGAFRSVPSATPSAPDFDLVRIWRETGSLTTHPTDSAHLTKPGWIALLRGLFPRGAADPGDARRFLVLNALLMVAGIGLATIALRKAERPASVAFLAFLSWMPQVRDACDYVASEATASGLVLLAFGAFVLGRLGSRFWALFAGVCMGLLFALRPNVGALVVAAAALMAIPAGTAARSGLWRAAISFLGTVLVAFTLFYAAGYRSSPRADATKTLLWGTLDYYWRPDAQGWPTGHTPEETARLQWARVGERWRSVLRDGNEDQRRSLEWKTLHGFVSSEELPSQWRGGRYQRLDRTLREWWWLAASTLAGLSVLVAVGGRGPFRFIGALVVAFCVLQSIACGADPRLTLPVLPLLAAGVAGALPAVRWSGVAIAAGTLTLALLVWRVSRIPDAAGYDFALVRGPGHRIEQTLRSSGLPARGGARVHFRLYEEPPYLLGFRASIGGTPVLERRPGDASSYPAYFLVWLTAQQVAAARQSGLSLSIESIGPPGSEGFFDFPLTPPVFGLLCRVDGDARVPSGFGGTASGGIPVWVTADETAGSGVR